jgi:hypothetical protein
MKTGRLAGPRERHVGAFCIALVAPLLLTPPALDTVRSLTQTVTLEHRFVLVTTVDQAGKPFVAGADSFRVENDSIQCEVVAVAPASYPLAVILDTSADVRSEFRTLQSAVAGFVKELPERDVAIYVSGAPVSRVIDFTRDQERLLHAVASPAAVPNSRTQTLDAVLRASKDLQRLKAPVSGIVAVSGGGPEWSPPAGSQVWAALQASRTMLNIVENRSLHSDGRFPQLSDGDVLEALSIRTHGKYVRGASAGVYASGLESVRQELEAQSLVEYTVPSGAPHALNLQAKAPAFIVMAVELQS